MREFDPITPRTPLTPDKGARIDLSTDSCKRFLNPKVNQKIGVMILYIHIVGSGIRMAAKMIPLLLNQKIIFSQSVYEKLSKKVEFVEIKLNVKVDLCR
jgi:hypothetical protein